MAENSWSSIPWTPFPPPSTPSSPTLSFHKQQVPYKPDANDLQNLEVWIPNPSQSSSQLPSSSETPSHQGTWIIYIHGGAWRDPLVTSSSFHSTVAHLLTSKSSSTPRIAGLASINYTLSPHPLHPTHPTPSPDSNIPIPPDRSAHHPLQIHDVLSAISYLQSKFNFTSNYILSGHSCGATLSFQAVMNQDRFFPQASNPNPHPHPYPYPIPIPSIYKPSTIVGLNGLYSLPHLLTSPGDKHTHLIPLYQAFMINAFGSNPKTWENVSPTIITDWRDEWKEGRRIVLVQSRKDTLVGWDQTGEMLDLLNRQLTSVEGEGDDVGSLKGKVKVEEMEASGDHNDLWKDGGRLAEIYEMICRDMEIDIEGGS